MRSLTAVRRLAPSVSLLLIFIAAAGVMSCELPILESAECGSAKNSVREFYSFHFGNDMHPSADGLNLRKRFLTPELFNYLKGLRDEQSDYFTQTLNDYPKAFRVGACRSADANNAVVQVLIFWKDDTRSEQRAINVDAVRANGDWLINKVAKN